MPEERVIIDGTDVTDCEYMLNNKIKGKQHCPAKAMPYAKETSCICRKSIDTPHNFCKHNPNCHYKQLRNLENKYTDLQKQYDNLMDINMHLQDKIKELKLLRCPNCNEEFLTPEGSKLLDEIWDLREENKNLLDKIKELKGEQKNVKKVD